MVKNVSDLRCPAYLAYTGARRLARVRYMYTVITCPIAAAELSSVLPQIHEYCRLSIGRRKKYTPSADVILGRLKFFLGQLQHFSTCLPPWQIFELGLVDVLSGFICVFTNR